MLLCKIYHFYFHFSIVNRIDYEATVKAANDAQNSAQQAQNNAAEAASKASLTSVHEVSSHGGSSYHGSEHGGGHLDAYGSQKTLTVTSAAGAQQSSSSNAHNGSAEKKSSDSTARSSNQVKTSAPSSEAIAANHNYSNKDFKPSHQYSYAGY